MWYCVELFSDAAGETEVAHGCNGADLVIEHLLEEVLLVQGFDEFAIAIVGVRAVGNEGAVLNDLVVGVVGAGDFELVVIEQGGRGVYLGEEGLIGISHNTEESDFAA